MNPILEVSDLSLSIPDGHIIQKQKQILNSVSFEVSEGKATAYLGPNGAGKTSTFRILCGLSKASSGSVHFKGKRIVDGLPSNQFGFMPEQPYFYKNLTPKELLHGLGKLSGIDEKQLNRSIDEWAEKLYFTKVINQRLSSCSKGQVQRVGLAQALIHEPSFILLDEPLSGLDPLGRECVREVIRSEVKKGATVLFSSHILSDAQAMCEHVIVLQQGTIAYSGAMKSLLTTDTSWLIRANWTTDALPHFEKTEAYRDVDGTLCLKAPSEEIRDHIINHILKSPDASLISVELEQRTLEQAFVEILKGKNETAS